jgi:hypothetical protein
MTSLLNPRESKETIVSIQRIKESLEAYDFFDDSSIRWTPNEDADPFSMFWSAIGAIFGSIRSVESLRICAFQRAHVEITMWCLFWRIH